MASSDYVKMSNYVSQSLDKINPGIGNYIHLHKGNYERHGITPNKEENALSSAVAAYADSKNQLKQMVGKSMHFNKHTIQQLEQFMTAAVYADWNKRATTNTNLGYGINSGKFVQIRKQWCTLAETVAFDMVELLQNPELKSSNLQKRKNAWQKEQKYSGNTQSVTIKTIEKLLTRITNTVSTINTMKETLSQEEINNLLNQAAALEKDIQSLQDTPEYQKALKGETRTVSKGTVIPKTNKTFGQLIEEINLFVNGSTSLAKSIGDSLEYFAAAVTLAARKEVFDKTHHAIKDVLKGSTHDKTKIDIGLGYGVNSNTMININYLQEEVKKQTSSPQGFKIDNAEISYTSQGTVDWEVSPNNLIFSKISKQLSQGFTASLKNYNNSKSIKMVQGTSLLSILNLMNTDFINHYLNILCHFPDSTIHTSYNKLIMYGTAVRGLTGSRGGSSIFKQNDLLIINDKNASRVRVFDVVDLLNKLEYDLEQIDKHVSITSFPKHATFEQANYKIPGGNKEIIASIRKRITKLVAKLHQQKITATLKASAFN